MRELICVFLVTCLVTGLLQSSMDKTVFGVHDGCLAVLMCLFLHTFRGFVAVPENLVSIGELLDIVLNVLVVFKEFYCKITSGELLPHIKFFFQVLLHVLYAILNLMSVIDMNVAKMQALVFCPLISLYDGMEEVLHSFSRFEHGGNHWNTEEL